MKAEVNWVEKLHLEGKSETGHIIEMDSTPSGQKSFGASPKELALQSLAGCTMMDVVSILQKQKIELRRFWIDVEGELAKEHPKVFTKIHLKYNFICDTLNEEFARKAIDLSREKYCAVSNMIGKTADITYSIDIKKSTDK